MIIYSKPGAATFRQVNLPELGKDYWYARQVVHEAETIPTSTTPAGVFRQVVNFGVSSIVRTYTVVLDRTKTAVLLAMQADSAQTSYYVNIGTAIYDCTISVEAVPLNSIRAQVKITFRVMSQIS